MVLERRRPRGVETPKFIAFDAPQGLPRAGVPRRLADEQANTPTRKLPSDRSELADWRIYRGLIEAGIDIFWSTYENGLANIWGLDPTGVHVTTILEAYPRYVIRRLWPELKIPSKRKAPLDYVNAIWRRIRERGYSCPGLERPAVDHVDAMLCAFVAEACLGGQGAPAGTVGCEPRPDEEYRVLREGWIVSP